MASHKTHAQISKQSYTQVSKSSDVKPLDWLQGSWSHHMVQGLVHNFWRNAKLWNKEELEVWMVYNQVCKGSNHLSTSVKSSWEQSLLNYIPILENAAAVIVHGSWDYKLTPQIAETMFEGWDKGYKRPTKTTTRPLESPLSWCFIGRRAYPTLKIHEASTRIHFRVFYRFHN